MVRMLCPACGLISSELFVGWELASCGENEQVRCQVCGAVIGVVVELSVRKEAPQ
jgi:predicted RNA-binding Zn-ribbon protein involved in translation (DUF1610 family)